MFTRTVLPLMVALALAQVPAIVVAGAGDDDVLALALATYDAANEAEEAGNDSAASLYAMAYDALLPFAEAGEPEAQFRLGVILFHGKGREKNPQAAFDWYYAAGSVGHPRAQTGVGYHYDYGIVVDEDYDKAICWYRTAANQGDPMAQYNLSLALDLLHFREAKRWRMRAVRQGYRSALYREGRTRLTSPFRKDKSEAVLYLLLAEELGDERAHRVLDTVRASTSSSMRRFFRLAEDQLARWEPTLEEAPTAPLLPPPDCLERR